MIVEITENISENTVFSKGNTYVIIGEIHVQPGILLKIENNVLVLIRNGTFPSSVLRKSVLIFDTGSRLHAADVYFKAGNNNNERVGVANNGGIWFLGSAAEASKDGIATNYSTNASLFNAGKIFTYYLGSKDPKKKKIKKNKAAPSTDQDAITIMGCGKNEMNVEEMISERSGDNGIDIIQSCMAVNNLTIINPGEDGVNLQSSQVTVCVRLKVLVPLTSVRDRDIFDFETNEGQSYLRIMPGVKTTLLGIFGDQLNLVSNDLPQPTGKLYSYTGIPNEQSYVYAVGPA